MGASDGSTGGIAWAFLLLALSAVTGALMAPVTRVIELEASRYTYYACREFFSMCIVGTIIYNAGVSPVGQPRNRPWFFLFGCAMWFFLWAYVKAMSYVNGSTWAALHYCTYPAFALFYGQAFPMPGTKRDKVVWPQLGYTFLRNAVVILLMAGQSLSLSGGAAWCLLTAAADGVSSHVLRGIRKTDSSLTAKLWSDVINVLLWSPPGIFGIRVEFLWPNAAPHTHLGNDIWWYNMSLYPTWTFMAVCGGLGMAGVVLFAQAVKVLPAAPASSALAPLIILFSLMVDLAQGRAELTAPIVGGVLVFVVTTALEITFGFGPPVGDDDDENGDVKAEPLLHENGKGTTVSVA